MPALMIDPGVFELRRMAQGVEPLVESEMFRNVLVVGFFVAAAAVLAAMVFVVWSDWMSSRRRRARHAGSRPVEADGFEETYDRIVSADEAAQVAQVRAQAEAELQLLDFLGSVEDLAPGQREQIEALRAKYLAVLDA